jgi:hypothetical protein
MSSSDSDREKEKWMASAEVREWSRGNKPAAPREVHPHVGMVGDNLVRRLLDVLAEHYDPAEAAEAAGVAVEHMPARVEDTRLYQTLLRRAGTETVTRAVHQGETQTQSFAVGDPAARSDISGLGAIRRLTDMLTTSAPIIYIFGPPGAGKSNFGLLAAQLWNREHPDGELASNIRTWQEADEWLPSYGSLREWLDEQTRELDEGGITRRDDANPRLFVFDEASSHASGRGSQGYEAGQKLGPLVYQIRKSACGLIIVGHDGKDVHPAVRTLATVVEKQRGEKKKASIYEDVVNRQGVGHIIDLDGIPETDFSYDDGEATSWSWDEAGGDEPADKVLAEAEEMAEEMHSEFVRRLAYSLDTAEWVDLRQTEIGEALGQAQRGEPFSQQWVSKQTRRFEGDADE